MAEFKAPSRIIDEEEAIRKREEELQKWRERKRKEKEDKALNQRTPHPRRSVAAFNPCPPTAPSGVTAKFVQSRKSRQSELVTSLRDSATAMATPIRTPSAVFQNSSSHLPSSTADNIPLTVTSNVPVYSTLSRREQLEIWKRERELKKAKTPALAPTHRWNATPRYNSSVKMSSPYHRNCTRTSQAPNTTNAHSTQSTLNNTIRRLNFNNTVDLKQLSQQITPKENVEIIKRSTDKVIASSFFQKTVLKVQRLIIRYLITQKCMKALKCRTYEEGIRLFEEMAKDPYNWPITRRCATYWILRAKFEEKFGHFNNVIDLYANATEFKAKPIDLVKIGMRQFLLRVKEREHKKQPEWTLTSQSQDDEQQSDSDDVNQDDNNDDENVVNNTNDNQKEQTNTPDTHLSCERSQTPTNILENRNSCLSSESAQSITQLTDSQKGLFDDVVTKSNNLPLTKCRQTQQEELQENRQLPLPQSQSVQQPKPQPQPQQQQSNDRYQCHDQIQETILPKTTTSAIVERNDPPISLQEEPKISLTPVVPPSPFRVVLTSGGQKRKVFTPQRLSMTRVGKAMRISLLDFEEETKEERDALPSYSVTSECHSKNAQYSCDGCHNEEFSTISCRDAPSTLTSDRNTDHSTEEIEQMTKNLSLQDASQNKEEKETNETRLSALQMENESETMILEFVTKTPPTEEQSGSSVIALEKSQVRRNKDKELLGTDVAVTPVRRSVRLSAVNENTNESIQHDEKNVADLLKEANFAFSPNKALRNFEQRKKSNKRSTKKMIATGERLLKALTRQAERKKKDTERKVMEKVAAALGGQLPLSKKDCQTTSDQTQADNGPRNSQTKESNTTDEDRHYITYDGPKKESLYKCFQRISSEQGYGMYEIWVPVKAKYIHPNYMTPLKARDPKLVLPDVEAIDDKDMELPTPVRRSYRLDSMKK